MQLNEKKYLRQNRLGAVPFLKVSVQEESFSEVFLLPLWVDGIEQQGFRGSIGIECSPPRPFQRHPGQFGGDTVLCGSGYLRVRSKILKGRKILARLIR